MLASILLIGVVSAFILISRKDKREREANRLLVYPSLCMERGMFKQALFGNSVDIGLLELVESYGGTAAGRVAIMNLSHIRREQGKYKEAFTLLEQLPPLKDLYIRTKVAELKADILRQIISDNDSYKGYGQDKVDQFYEEALQDAPNIFREMEVLLKMARVNLLRGNKGKALQIYLRVQSYEEPKVLDKNYFHKLKGRADKWIAYIKLNSKS